jgi:hypothetical protein
LSRAIIGISGNGSLLVGEMSKTVLMQKPLSSKRVSWSSSSTVMRRL